MLSKILLCKSARVVFTRVVLAATLLYLLVGFLDFGDFALPTQSQARNAKIAIVLGGGEERISLGLKLVHEGTISRFFISGDNLKNYNTFVSFFTWRNPDLPDIEKILECCIEWSRRAKNTIQNAMEAKCWLTKEKISGPILLITSPMHMGRALFVLSEELGNREIIPYPAPDPWHPTSKAARTHALAIEYVKYVAIRAYYWLTALGGRGILRSALGMPC